jgi:hypothetical protein
MKPERNAGASAKGTTGPTQFRRAEDVVLRTVGTEAVAVPVRHGVGDLESVYTFNETARFVWDRLAEPVSLDALVEVTVAEFAVDPETARRDLEELLRDLAGERLVLTS